MYRSDGQAPTSSGCGCSSSTRTAGCGCGSSGSCGCGLQRLSRPRFFDGQLVTAATFGRLDSYAVAKARLHNRYLHGVGVVCGLEAVCNPCDDTVTVRPGYALGPCGEDIVVSEDTRVDVGGLVREHRRARVRPDCPPYTDRPVDCEAAHQKWVLGICYDERPGRPTTSLRRRSSCGCGTADEGTSLPTPSGTRTPAGCEPTSVCEGFRFRLTKLAAPAVRAVPQPGGPPGTVRAAPAVSGELPERVRRCLELLRSGLTRLPQDPELDELVTYCCDLHRDLRDLIGSGSTHDCSLGQRLGEVVCPDPQEQDARSRAVLAISAMLQIAVDLYRSCVCSALLPPCDTGCGEDCVPLAVVTVRSSDLRVLDICNWSERQLAVTAPALSYWFGWLPVFDALRAQVERLCCEQGRRVFAVDERMRVRDAGSAHPDDDPEDTDGATGPIAGSEAAAPGEPEISSLLELAAAYARTPSAMSGVDTTVLGALGALTPGSRPLASELELANPLPALALGRGIGAVRAALAPEVLSRLDLPAIRENRAGSELPDDRLARLEQALAGLQQTVDEQAATIRSLREQGPPP